MAINLWGSIERKSIKPFKMVTGQIKSSRQLSQADDRNITLKKIIYFLQFKGMPVVFPFGITINIRLNGSIMLWEKESFVTEFS